MIILAPLRGLTGLRFRIAFMRHFGGLDAAVAPFIPTVAGEQIKPVLLNGIRPDWQPENLPLTPQVIGRDFLQLRVMLMSMKALGYSVCDLNAGCPWPFVAKKGRGSGLLAKPETLQRLLETGCEIMPNGFSVKLRLGMKTPTQLQELIPMINSLPLKEICIHPRTATQMYSGKVDLENFTKIYEICTRKIIYNGDIKTTVDYDSLQKRFPKIQSFMIGRGLLSNPFLPEMIKTGRDTRDANRLREFLDELFALYASDKNGDHAILGRVKELWSHLRFGLANGEKLWQSIKLTRTADEYRRVLDVMPFRFDEETKCSNF